ncbi:MAG: hypothetical protein Q4D51_10960 [Eubacteriales bacterium]|nr:hypothetical protein [Eubacteriales bacterium]
MKELQLYQENTLMNYEECELFFSDKSLVDYIASEKIQYLGESIVELEEDYIDIKFDENVPKADQNDYLIAASCGFVSGMLSIFGSKKFDLENAHKWGNDKADELVKDVAKHFGYKGDDLKESIRFLEKNFPMAGDALTNDFGGGKQHHLRDFSHHASPVGLICSIAMQFTGEGYGTDTQGNFIRTKIIKDGFIGKSFPEKIVFGVFNWFLHLVSDFDGSSGSVLNGTGKGTGIPGPMLSLLKELATLPIFKKVNEDNINKPKVFSEYVSKLFNGTRFKNENGEPIKFDLRTEIGIGHFIMDQNKPVVINECLVRSIFFLTRFVEEVKAKNIQSVLELDRLNPSKFIPIKNRALTRMLTIASGTFVAVNVSGTAVKAAAESKGVKEVAIGEFFLRVNYVGIGRLCFACVADAKYIADDLKDIYENYYKSVEQLKQSQFTFGANFLSLTDKQNQILYSLKKAAVLYDIEITKDAKEEFVKKEWLSRWEESTATSFGVSREEYFLDEDVAYELIEKIDEESNSQGWMYLLSLELALFQAYYSFDEYDKDLFKGLKCKGKYVMDSFVNKQAVVTKDDYEGIIKNYKSYEMKLKESGKKVATTVVTTVVTTALTGGLALAFAPEIAVVLAGETVAGLSGAALTSASLATIGGGSLAAGGLGMAGGTAILTGGGALIGLAGSGSASLLSVIGQISEDYTLNECCKLLTFCKMIVIEKHNQPEMLNYVIAALETCVSQTEEVLDEIEEKTKDNKKKIKRLNLCLKYINNTIEELDSMLSNRVGFLESKVLLIKDKTVDVLKLEKK